MDFWSINSFLKISCSIISTLQFCHHSCFFYKNYLYYSAVYASIFSLQFFKPVSKKTFFIVNSLFYPTKVGMRFWGIALDRYVAYRETRAIISQPSIIYEISTKHEILTNIIISNIPSSSSFEWPQQKLYFIKVFSFAKFFPTQPNFYPGARWWSYTRHQGNLFITRTTSKSLWSQGVLSLLNMGATKLIIWIKMWRYMIDPLLSPIDRTTISSDTRFSHLGGNPVNATKLASSSHYLSR